MNLDEHSAVDLSNMSMATFNTYLIKNSAKENHNKENLLLDTTNLANVSISSLGAGILCETNQNLNLSTNAALASNGLFNPNESFDNERCKLDVYEQSINRLVNENKALRKRVKNLTELARAKEQEMIESLNKACEENAQLEEKTQKEHNFQLQSYYECFLAIEKENNQLKLKIDQMRAKLIEQQGKLEEVTREKTEIKELLDSKGDETPREDLNTMSIMHINDELTNAHRTAEKYVEENKHLTMEKVSFEENECLKQKIDELTIEKTTLEKRLDTIEKSLQRWIFRACDDKCSLKKVEDKCERLEADLRALMSQNDQLKSDKEALAKMLELNQVQLDDTRIILEQTKLLLNDKDVHIDKISTLNRQLEIENQEIILKLEHFLNKTYTTNETQTEQQSVTKTSSSCSKLNELSTLNGHVAKTAAKFNNNPAPTASSSLSSAASTNDLSNELKTVKLKNDNLIIEKSQLKFKNDELKFENDELKAKVEDLIKQMSQFKQDTPKQANQTKSVVVSQAVQTPRVHHHTQETQTNQVSHQVDQVNTKHSASDLLWRTKFDSIKHELDHVKAESHIEVNKVKQSLMSQIETLKVQCAKFEKEILEEKAKIDKLNLANKELSTELSTKNTECSHLTQSIEKLNTDHKKEKQISDTIIQQQKKLLYFLQMKLNPDQPDMAHHHLHHNQHNTNTLNHNLMSKKLFKRNKQNPLLANLSKPTVPYQFSNNNQTPTNTLTNDINKKTVKEIEAELNSNYVAYSELNRERKPPTIPVPIPKQLQEQETKPAQPVLKPVKEKKIHVFITGLNTCPIYCDVCQHLIPLIAYASKCQLCSFTCHSTCSNMKKSMSSKSRAALLMAGQNSTVLDPLKYCHMNYLRISQLYNNYIQKLSQFVSVSQLDKANSSLLADYLHVYVDNKWKKFWIVLRIDGQLELYQTKTNLKPFEAINLSTEKIMFETDYNQIKKLASTSSANTSQSKSSESEDVNLYEQVDANQRQALQQDQSIDYAQSSLIILVYNQKLSHQIAFDTFSTKSVWLDALQSASLIGHKNTKQFISNSADQFKTFNITKVLNPFLELSDTTVNSYCIISQKLIALACDDGLYINQVETESSSPNISLIKIDTIESAHKLSYQAEFGKLCLIGKRSRQFLSIDTNELLSKPLVQQKDDIEYEQDEDYPKINVKIEHIQNIDRCHLFESYLNENGYWYLAVATPETIFILLFNKTTSKYTLVKTINTQADSPCLCLKFSNLTNQLIYGCSKEFFKLDMTYLQPTPIMDSLNKKSNNDDEFNQLVKMQKQPIGISVINLPLVTDCTAVLLCYEEYALILTYNKTISNWQLQQQQFNLPQQQQQQQLQTNTISKKTSSSSSLSANLSNYSCLKWPRGSPPLQIEFNSNNLYLFYNDSIVVYKVSFDLSESLFVFKKSGVAFVYKPRHLSSYQHASENYLIISNRRPAEKVMSTQINDHDNRPYYDYEAENDYNDGDMLDDDDILSGASSSKMIDQEDNDRICLSYFCCP